MCQVLALFQATTRTISTDNSVSASSPTFPPCPVNIWDLVPLLSKLLDANGTIDGQLPTSGEVIKSDDFP